MLLLDECCKIGPVELLRTARRELLPAWDEGVNIIAVDYSIVGKGNNTPSIICVEAGGRQLCDRDRKMIEENADFHGVIQCIVAEQGTQQPLTSR